MKIERLFNERRKREEIKPEREGGEGKTRGKTSRERESCIWSNGINVRQSALARVQEVKPSLHGNVNSGARGRWATARARPAEIRRISIDSGEGKKEGSTNIRAVIEPAAADRGGGVPPPPA